MIEEIISTKSMETPEEGAKASRKAKKGGKKAAKKSKKAALAAEKPVKVKKAKKAASKASRKAKKGGKKGRKAAAKVVVGKLGAEGAPSILLVGAGEQAEPVWVKYAQMTPAKPSKRPTIPTDVKIGNLVGWRTDGGKDRIGIVQEFRADSAVLNVGGRVEVIRICRLIKLADKVKEA